MPFLNRCIWLAVSPGLGSFVVSGVAQNGYTPAQCLDPAVIDGATYHYFAVNDTQHEEGDGVWNSTTSTLTRATIRNSSKAGAAVDFNAVPTVFMGGPTATDILPMATANIALFVNPSTGSDSNNGSNTTPFKTIAHAVAVAASYDYQNLYNPVISLVDGSYTGVQQTLPILTRCPVGGIILGNNTTPANVTIADSGTSWTFTLANFSFWGISGVAFAGSYGGIKIGGYANLDLEAGKINFSGSLANGGLFASGSVNGFGATLTTTTAAMGTLIFGGYICNFDNSSIVFSNPVTFSGPVISLDTTYAFFGFGGSSFTHRSNVTVASGSALAMTNDAYFETLGTATVDGAALTRANFPGAAGGPGVGTNFPSFFEPDNAYTLNSNKSLAWLTGPSGGATIDTGISRFASGVISVGTGTAGDFSGIFIASGIVAVSLGIGYANGLGAGGVVTQGTSKSTGVTLNKTTGQITMNNALLGAGSGVSFVMTNSAIVATDILHVNHASGGTLGNYLIQAQCAAGSATINVLNLGLSGGLSDAIVIGFAKFNGSIN